MVLITTHVPREQLRVLDKLVESELYPSRSEAIRRAIQALIERHKMLDLTGEHLGELVLEL